MTQEHVEPELPEVLSLSQVADRLSMKRSNVTKFLTRRGIRPAIKKAAGYFWRAEEIERVKAEREADTRQMEADRRRRESALNPAAREEEPKVPGGERLGDRQKAVLRALLNR